MALTSRSALVRFTEALEAWLIHDYPKADITVKQSINDRVMVDGMTDHDEVPRIEQVIDKVWNGDEWLVHEATSAIYN